MELRFDERLIEERRRHEENMSKREREKIEQMDYITQRLQRVEREYEELKLEVPRLHAEITKLKNEKMEIQGRLLDKQENYNVLYDDHIKLNAKYHKHETLLKKERNATGQLLDEMAKELEELRNYKMQAEGGLPDGSISERYGELQNEIQNLREENKHLHDSNEELNAQLLNQCIGEGKLLVQPTEGQSSDEDLEHLTNEELLEQLILERDINFRLKQYVDRIIITVLEKNPSLLEITHR